MRTKRIVMTCSIWALMVVTSVSFAQPGRMKEGNPRERKERIESYKIAFITSRLQLTPQEAEKFWPVYNEFDAKKESIRKSARDRNKEYNTADKVTDKQATELIEADLTEMQANVDLMKEYYGKIKAVLPPQKIVLLIHAERQFRRDLIQKLGERKK